MEQFIIKPKTIIKPISNKKIKMNPIQITRDKSKLIISF